MNDRHAVPVSRREVLRAGLCAGGFALAARAGATPSAPRTAKARAVIQVWLAGGPSHLDTFDPKPGAGADYCGPLDRPIATNVPGIVLGELLPLLAKQADKYSLLRAMTHGVNAHETASYLVQTGRKAGDGVVYPSVGSIVSLFSREAGYGGLIPPYVMLTQPQGRFSEAGFLGSRHQPFATGGNPAQDPFVVEGVVAPGVSRARQERRRELLHALDTLGDATSSPELQALRECEEQAYGLILGDAGKVFDLSTEKPETRERYGRNAFGQSCLLARRLVESGVRYVTIHSQGWDTHKDAFPALRRKVPELDRGLATLLEELALRGLLASTIVWCCGEFGRTPKIQREAPWNGGRGHHGRVFSALVAGGGFRGGMVVGRSDARGEEVAERPVHPVDVIAGIYELLGIDRDARLPHPQGLDVRVLPPSPETQASAGRLRELL